MNKRLQMLQQLVADGSTDPFHHYALALEHKRKGQREEALGVFEKLREAHSDYLPMYMMAAQLLVELDRAVAAREWLEQGLALARQRSDTKTAGELQELLEQTS